MLDSIGQIVVRLFIPSWRRAACSIAALSLAMTFMSGPAAAADKCLKVASQGVVAFLKKERGRETFIVSRSKRSVHINDRRTGKALYYFTAAAYLDPPLKHLKGYIFYDFNNKVVAFVREENCKLDEVRAY